LGSVGLEPAADLGSFREEFPAGSSSSSLPGSALRYLACWRLPRGGLARETVVGRRKAQD